jgi:hypothetical protein
MGRSRGGVFRFSDSVHGNDGWGGWSLVPGGSERRRPGPARIIMTRLVLMDYYRRRARIISWKQVARRVRGSRAFAFAYPVWVDFCSGYSTSES